MREDTQLRFYLVDKLLRVPYGSRLVIEAGKVRSAWPPTGDHDPDGWFHAMALANAGRRPEISFTTDERIERDLDGSFVWSCNVVNGDYVFRRRVECCPKCKGSGYFEELDETHLSDSFPVPGDVSVEEVVVIKHYECKHIPK